MAGIEELKSKVSLKNGLAFSHHFAVELPPFAGMRGDTMNILCKDVDMPGKQILTLDRSIGVHTEKVVNGFAMSDLNMTFYMTNDYGPRKYFDEWMSQMVNEENGNIQWKKGKDGSGGFAKDITIHQLSKPQARFGFDLGILDINFDLFGSSIYSVTLEDAFPITQNAISLTSQGGIVELQVNFAYTKWVVKKDARSKLADLIDSKIGINLGGII